MNNSEQLKPSSNLTSPDHFGLSELQLSLPPQFSEYLQKIIEDKGIIYGLTSDPNEASFIDIKERHPDVSFLTANTLERSSEALAHIENIDNGSYSYRPLDTNIMEPLLRNGYQMALMDRVNTFKYPQWDLISVLYEMIENKVPVFANQLIIKINQLSQIEDFFAQQGLEFAIKQNPTPDYMSNKDYTLAGIMLIKDEDKDPCFPSMGQANIIDANNYPQTFQAPIF